MTSAGNGQKQTSSLSFTIKCYHSVKKTWQNAVTKNGRRIPTYMACGFGRKPIRGCPLAPILLIFQGATKSWKLLAVRASTVVQSINIAHKRFLLSEKILIHIFSFDRVLTHSSIQKYSFFKVLLKSEISAKLKARHVHIRIFRKTESPGVANIETDDQRLSCLVIQMCWDQM